MHLMDLLQQDPAEEMVLHVDVRVDSVSGERTSEKHVAGLVSACMAAQPFKITPDPAG
jgi:hypothetical protein